MAFEEFNGCLFGPTWKTSGRMHEFRVERDVKVPLPDGTRLSSDIWRPAGPERFPAVLGFHPYHPGAQTGPIKPTKSSAAQWRNPGEERTRASLEAGDPAFFARRGYAHVVCNARGTGKSEGEWDFVGPQELMDVYETIEWIASQPWCDGNVAMFGVSYLAWIQLFAATLNPPHLKALFCPWGATDFYRDVFVRGGIPTYKFPIGWSHTSLTYGNCKPVNHSRNEMGEEGYRNAIRKLLEDDDFRAAPEIVEVLKNPETGPHPFVVDLLLHPLYDEFWIERTADYGKIKTPAFIGACWCTYGIHLPAAFRSWEGLDVPKKMVIGPPHYLDRPVYQLQHEAVRWFDYWLKGVDTGIMNDPPVRVFIMNADEWKEGSDWPFPETRFTPFYLHENGLLSEHEHWPYEGSDSFEDSPWMRGSLTYVTPSLVENTEVVGPIMLKLFASTTDTDVHWIISLLEIDSRGNEHLLTKGWLKGSHRELDLARSKPWEPIYTHRKSDPLAPGQIYEYLIKIVPTGNLFKAGSRVGLKISCADDEPKTSHQLVGTGSLRRTAVSRVTVFHDDDHPSYLLLPITKGNLFNTYFSGGDFPA